ncbi:MAG: DUF456 family protein [Planctomycetota bacterium]
MGWWILAVLALDLVNLALLVLVLAGLPGTWLMLGLTALCEWLIPVDLFDASTLWLALGLALLGEVFEFTMGSAGARRAGAGRAGALGALLGGILGGLGGTFLIPIPVVGSLAGAAIGAMGLATLLEHSGGMDLRSALRAGTGAAKGQVSGTIVKLALGLCVWLLLAVASVV